MPNNYILLEKITVGAAGASSVTFSGIPQTGYTDLKVVLSGRSDQSGITAVNIAFNGSTANLSYRSIFGDGSSAASYSGTNPQIQYLPGTSQTANTFNNAEMYIPNYAGSTNKSFSVDQVQETNATTAYIVPFAGLWSQTAAITSITFSLATGNFVQNSTFYLYGVAKLGTTPAIVPYATGGDTIMTDGTYWYHTFISSGTFTPAKAITCDYLVVAGGGGSSNATTEGGGGGGAGGLRSTVTATGGGGSLETALSLGTSAYTVTIGAGGTAGTSGSNSVFSTITSTGGGRGGSVNSPTPATGGSGGGGGAQAVGNSQAGASGTANQGYAGSAGVGSDTLVGSQTGGAGGGAGAVGGTSTASTGGNGGAGVAVSISGSSVTYAGGGGAGKRTGGTAGSGGAGGGGAGASNAVGTNGTANTGGGGGGSGDNSGTTKAGANGGSGIVIIRYAVA